MKAFFPKLKKSLGIFTLFGLLFAAAVATSGYFYYKYADAQKQLRVKNESIDDLVSKVARHILLPTGETPTVMTVTDTQKLSGQVFFSNAKNDDKVLIYEKSKKAFLYDVAGDRVLEVGPVTFETPSALTASPSGAPAAGETQSGSLRFVLLNGTRQVGLTNIYERTLTDVVPNANVVDRDSAKKRDYETSFLVDVTGTKTAQAQSLAKDLELTLTALPEGEATRDADFIIIVGEDKK